MKISLEILLELLQEVEWVEAACPMVTVPFENAPISEAALFPMNSTVLDREILWCGFLTNILIMDGGIREGHSFLCLGTPEEFAALTRKNDCNCIYFPNEVGLPAVFNETTAVIRRFQVWEHEMDLAIARHDGFQKMVDLSEDIMDNPIVIFNNSFEIQAYSQSKNIDRPQLKKILDAGRFSGEDLEILAKMNYMRDSDQYSAMQLFYPPNWMNCQFAMRIFMEGQRPIVTMVQYFLQSPPTPAQLEILHMFELKMEVFTERVLKTGQRGKNYVYEPFLIDLIDGHIRTREDIVDRIRAVHFPFEAQYRLYQIQFGKYTVPLASHARNNCKSIFPSSKLVTHHECLYMLDREDGAARKGDTETYRRAKLEKLLELCEARCGVSGVVPDLTYIHATVLETQSALNVGNLMYPEQRICIYQSAFFWDMIDYYTTHRGIPAGLLYYRPLDAVIENDQNAGNDNLRLLDIYLNCDRNITNTAKRMNLHRNSVIYRLERVEQMLGGSLDDPDLRFDLLISLKILNYLEQKKKS